MESISWLLLTLASVWLIWRVARRVLPVLVSRYDSAAMRVEPAAGPAVAAQSAPSGHEPADSLALAAWCSAGAGPGGGSFWRPGLPPRLEKRFTVAVWSGGDLAAIARVVERFSRQLDGSDQLREAGGALGGLLLRLRVKLNDVMWWRARQPSDPWDCGYLVCEPSVRQALSRFQPRRATLMVADTWPADALQQAIESLSAQSPGFQHPVRLLVTGSELPALRLPPDVLVSKLETL